MIKINKQLDRPDGGKVSAGSIVDYSTRMLGETMQVVYYLKHYFSQTAIDDGKQTIPGVTNFAYKQVKNCTEAEWSELNLDAGAGPRVQDWLKEILDELIGAGNTEII
jgi:hypothetical protein